MARETGPSMPRTAPATNQVRRLIATRLATAPSAESTARAGAKWTRLRSRAPSAPTSACPSEAATSTPPTRVKLLRAVPGSAQPLPQQVGQEPHGERTAAEEADEGHRTDQQALAVTEHRVADDDDEQQEVDHRALRSSATVSGDSSSDRSVGSA